MWRFFPGSIRECLKSKYSKKIQTREPTNHICGLTKRLGVYNVEHNNCHFEEQGRSGPRPNAKGYKRTWETNYSHILQRNWIGALGWSGILIVGWCLSQPTHLRTLINKKHHHNERKEQYVNPARILVRSVLAQPLGLNQILPSGTAQITSKEDTNKAATQFVNGPLDEAMYNFGQAQASVENRIGVELASRQFYKDAAYLFQRAVERGHVTAAFNLALCHEMGLGTEQDFQKAAELYEMASSGGHATATYNLGVFYVHGWGGKKADCARARQLFISAAKLGQVDAQRALGLADKKAQQVAENTTVLTKSDKSLVGLPVTQLVKDTICKYTSLLEC